MPIREVRAVSARRTRGAGAVRIAWFAWFAWLALLLSSSLLLLSSTAAATSTGLELSLDELVENDGSFLSSGGDLLFSNFAVEVSGGDGDPSEFRVKAKFDGFTLYGGTPGVPLTEDLDIRLTYDVETARQGLVMTAVGLSSDKWNPLGGNVAAIEASNEGGQVIGFGTRIEDAKRFALDFHALSEVVMSLSISEEIHIDDSIQKTWELKRHFRVEQGYPTTSVPEPNTALLLGLGMAGIASYSRRRS